MLTLTTAAEQHFMRLIGQETEEELDLRISVLNPGTPQADVGITFCPRGEQQTSDITQNFNGFKLYVDAEAVDYLQDARIDYVQDDFGGELSVKAPNIRGFAPDATAPLAERVEYMIHNQINPNLASHGGFVSLVEVLADNVVVLQFGGGCQGCGMADITLKSGIEKTLLAECPDIKAVQDVTDHAAGENPYC